ncbi:hypothetical protein TNCV_853731 [Trichonephila clavipes]|nr:hypothetical protein TNCV_853731 [Trichonephila clavipes]
MSGSSPYQSCGKGDQEKLLFLPLPPTSLGDLRIDEYLEWHYAAKALHLQKRLYLFQDSNLVATTRYSLALAIISSGRLYLVMDDYILENT